MKKIGIILCLMGVIQACNSISNPNSDNSEKIGNTAVDTLKNDKKVATDSLQKFNAPEAFAKFCFNHLKMKNFKALKPYLSKELNFSPQVYLSNDNLLPIQSNKLSNDTSIIIYKGVKQGSGMKYQFNLSQFIAKYLKDFNMDSSLIKVSTSKHKVETMGTMQNNLSAFFPKTTFVKFSKKASQKGGMDWQELIFILKIESNNYKLIGLVNNQWSS